MDPNAVYDVVLRESDIVVRAQAAVELLAWLAKGGVLPDMRGQTNRPVWRHHVVLRCEFALNRVIDRSDMEPDATEASGVPRI